MKLLPRAGLFTMIGGSALVGWVTAPMTTTAYVSVVLAAAITIDIVKDRWFS